MPFYPAPFIGNPSLEQYSGYCYNYIANGSLSEQVLMRSVFPFWQSPIQNSWGIEYFGTCNNFSRPFDSTLTENAQTGYQFRPPLVPLPIPDGAGVFGFYSQRTQNGSRSSDTLTTKVYYSTNLLHSLKKDSLYRMLFYLGFGTKDTVGKYFHISGSPTKMELFGLADSSKLPFPNKRYPNGATLGCLTQAANQWVSLGTCIISGTGEWVQASIDFTAPTDLQSLAIGPACDFSDVSYPPVAADERGYFYYLDKLQLYQASAPKPMIEVTGGSFCDVPGASLTLHMKSDNYYKGSQLQWYKNNSPINQTNSSITITKNQYGEGWYQCGVQNDSVCIRSDSFHVFWDPFLSSTLGNNTDTTACNGDTVLLVIHGGSNASYLWSNGTFGSSIAVTQSGLYSVNASNACNAVTATKNVQFNECPPSMFVPSAFTPNHDGLNDVFRAYYKGTIKSFKFSVYNRYGQQIFYSEDPTKGWNGTVKHVMQDQGVFVWMIQYTDGLDKPHTDKGTVVLIR